jgi:hypothetical protein
MTIRNLDLSYLDFFLLLSGKSSKEITKSIYRIPITCFAIIYMKISNSYYLHNEIILK